MPSTLFRAATGFEIFSNSDFQNALVQILTGTAAPNQTPASGQPGSPQDAPVGSIWLVNGGTQSTTKTYQKFRDTFNDFRDWRDITQTLSWRDPVEVRDTANATLPTGTPSSTITIDGQTISNGERVLFDGLTATAGTDTIQSSVPQAGTDTALSTAGTYYFTVATDGGAPVEYSVVIAGATTFNALAALMDTAYTAGTVAWDDANDQFLFTSGTTGSSSSVEAFKATASSPSLYSTIESEATGAPLVLSEELGILGVGRDIYIYDQATATFYLDPAQSATDGDAVMVQSGTNADQAYYYNGTQWVQFGSGSAAEEGFIRQFIGKDGTGAETPSYENPTETSSGDQPADRDPFTDATGQGSATASMGYIVWENDNLELAIAKLNAELFQNNRHLYVASATSLVDTVPTWVDGCEWIVRVQEGASVRQYIVTATTDGTTADFSTHTLQKIGATNLAGLSITVTVVGGSLTLTVSTTNAGSKMIRRVGTVGVAGAGNTFATGTTGALHVYS